MAEASTGKMIPPYAPFETIMSVIDQMAKTFVPQRLDAELMPKMSGGMRSNVLSGLRSLGLIDAANHPTADMETLVEARKIGGERWPEMLGVLVRDKYGWALKGFDLGRVTSKQLRERFQDVGGVDGVMNDRAVRFFLKALTDAKIEFSPHLNARRPRGTVPRRPAQPKGENGASLPPANDATTGKTHKTETPSLPDGMFDVPIPIADMKCFIRVPLAITTKQMPLVQAAIGVVAALAAQNEPSSKSALDDL